MSSGSGATGPATWQWGNPRLERTAALVRPHLPTELTGRLEPAGAGDFCFAYRTGPWIVRVARHAEAAEAIRREACVLDRISQGLPLAVPRPEHHSPEGCPPFSVHRELIGAVLTRAAWAGLSPVARGRLAEQLAGFLQRLHGLADDGRACGLPALHDATQAARLRVAAGRELRELLAADVAKRLDDFLAARAAGRGAERPSVLLHADVAPGHLLYDESTGELTGVIDFGDLVLGPPARDFIFIYEDFSVERCEEVVAAYAGADAAELMENVRAWYLLEALSWTLERLAQGARDDVAQGLGAIARELGA